MREIIRSREVLRNLLSFFLKLENKRETFKNEKIEKILIIKKLRESKKIPFTFRKIEKDNFCHFNFFSRL